MSLAALLGAAGCQGNDSGLTADQEKMGNNVNAWAKSSGGDWDKLTPDQQQTMIKSVGNEKSARMVLQMTAHKPEPITPGPPPGWKPGGPPPSK